ncbi:hypothetical protein [Mesorhizobium australicum]|uniref:hypothetical protein n=1 Tax=Mesorhizobium australicum TaxID=536018 RepID=UPI00059B250B|nr:hypothetical protein [Mesorhizobium australicum]
MRVDQPGKPSRSGTTDMRSTLISRELASARCAKAGCAMARLPRVEHELTELGHNLAGLLA